MPHIVDWTRTGEPGQTYDDASEMYSDIISQWGLYTYHVLANVGGMYINRPDIDDNKPAYVYVPRQKQRSAVEWLCQNVLCYPQWLFNNKFSHQVFLLRNTPFGTTEMEPVYMLKNQQNYILWDLLDNSRLIRMYDNEMQNGKNAFTAVEMMNMLHRHIFAKTIAGQTPDVMERSLQKSFVDALITAAAEGEGVKINKHLNELSSAQRTIEMTSTQLTRNSDALSLKRGELMRIRQLLRARRAAADLTARMHYDDILMRIDTALGLQK